MFISVVSELFFKASTLSTEQLYIMILKVIIFGVTHNQKNYK